MIPQNQKPKTDPGSWMRRIYLPEILKGMWITLKHIFIKKYPQPTLNYPEEKDTLPQWYRAFPRLTQRANGEPRCVACKLCEIACPSEAIYIEPEEVTEPHLIKQGIERRPKVFNIHFGRCINCSLCEEACPENAIVMHNVYEMATYDVNQQIFTKEKLLTMYGPTRKE